MGRMLLVSVVVYLVASWAYILLLRAQVRDCMTYIRERIAKCNPGFDSAGGKPQQEHVTKERGNFPRVHSSAAVPAQPERATLTGKPHLIVDSSGNQPSLDYRCSHCLRTFPLPENQPAKGAAAELFRCFREHVEQEHLTRSIRTTFTSHTH
jgi:hypothetical protein